MVSYMSPAAPASEDKDMVLLSLRGLKYLPAQIL